MLCDTCTKATVCRLKEDCNRLERSLKPNAVEDILSVEIKCKEYQSKATAQGIKSPVTFPIKSPYINSDNPFKWDTQITCSNVKKIGFRDMGNGYAKLVEI
jgi:hypothetical protein